MNLETSERPPDPPRRWRYKRLALSSSLPGHPRVHTFAEALRLSDRSALALLVQLWSCALREKRIKGLTPAYLAALCEWTDSDGLRSGLVAALVGQSFIEREALTDSLFRVQFPRDMARPSR